MAVRVKLGDYILFLKKPSYMQNEQNVLLNCEMSFSEIVCLRLYKLHNFALLDGANNVFWLLNINK